MTLLPQPPKCWELQVCATKQDRGQNQSVNHPARGCFCAGCLGGGGRRRPVSYETCPATEWGEMILEGVCKASHLNLDPVFPILSPSAQNDTGKLVDPFL